MEMLTAKLTVLAGVSIAGLIGAANMRVTSSPPDRATKSAVTRHDLGSFPDTRPVSPLRLLFIHHSVGGVLLADAGDTRETGGVCIYDSHPNGGSLRSRLSREGYEVHESSYGSLLGEDTDLFDWVPKFRKNLDRMVLVDRNDLLYSDGRRNDVVIFKSCFPNSNFVGEGTAPGNPAGPELTVANAKATMTALLPEFSKRPDLLFVYMTAPPLAAEVFAERLWKLTLKKALGHPTWAEEFAAKARHARTFNDWVASADGWLGDYSLSNVAVFDLYDILTDRGASDLLRYPTELNGVADSHPSKEGNANVTTEFVPFLNRAVKRAGLSR